MCERFKCFACCHGPEPSKRRNKALCLMINSFVLFTLAVILPSYIDSYVKNQIKDNVLISEKFITSNSLQYWAWADTSSAHAPPTYEKFWLWNLTNPQDVMNGSKPILKEVGPYAYQVYIKKINVSIVKDRANSEQVQYKTWETYHFSKEKSFKGADAYTDNITMLNLHMLGAYHLNPAIAWLMYSGLSEEKRLSQTMPVNWWLFGGVDPYTSIQEYPGMFTNMTYEEAMSYPPTSEYTGEVDISHAHHIVKYAGEYSIKCVPDPLLPKHKIDCWGDEPTNMFGESTDGTHYPPLNTLKRGGTVAFYNPGLRRVFRFTNVNDTTMTVAGADIIKYILPKKSMLNCTTNPKKLSILRL